VPPATSGGRGGARMAAMNLPTTYEHRGIMLRRRATASGDALLSEGSDLRLTVRAEDGKYQVEAELHRASCLSIAATIGDGIDDALDSMQDDIRADLADLKADLDLVAAVLKARP